MAASRRYNGARLAATCMLLMLPPRASAADEGKEPIHFEYVAAPECPPADRFLDQISAYTTRWTLARPSEEGRRFVVRIGRRDQTYVGRFDLREATGDTAGRDIAGESCEDAALGLAVAVALAIDPQAALAPGPAPVAEPGSSPEPPRPAPPLSVVEADKPVGIVSLEPSTPSPSHFAFSVGGRAEANGAVSGMLGVIDVFVELEWAGVVAHVPSFRPALRGGFRNAFTRTARVGEARAEIDWSAGYGEACPARFAVARRLTFEGCLGANLGVLSADAAQHSERSTNAAHMVRLRGAHRGAMASPPASFRRGGHGRVDADHPGSAPRRAGRGNHPGPDRRHLGRYRRWLAVLEIL